MPEVVPEARAPGGQRGAPARHEPARIGGFAVAGGAVALLGAGWAMALNAGLLLASAAFTAALRLPTTASVAVRERRRAARAAATAGASSGPGSGYGWSCLQYSFVLMVLQAVIGVLGPVVAQQRLGGATGWSIILGAESVGMLVGVALAIRARPRYPVRLGGAADVPGRQPAAGARTGSAVGGGGRRRLHRRGRRGHPGRACGTRRCSGRSRGRHCPGSARTTRWARCC